MEVRLNKLISDSGLCSRREADKLIEEGRITVNGSLPQAGQKITEADIVTLDDLRINIGKNIAKQNPVSQEKTHKPAISDQQPKEKKERKEKTVTTVSEKKTSATSSEEAKGLRPGKYVKYNKYAAARHAARSGEKAKSDTKTALNDKDKLKDALQPKFGKSLGRSAVAQRLAASPKSAALRKTSKNNPNNNTKRSASRNKPR